MLEETEKQIRQHLHDINGELFLVRGTAELAQLRFQKGSREAVDMDKIMQRVDNIVAHCNNIRAEVQKEQEHCDG